MDGIRRAHRKDARSLAPRLGYGDLLEVLALGFSPEAVLLDMVDHSEECWVAEIGGLPQVIFGVAKGTELSNVYSPFLLASSKLPAVRFFKEVRDVVEEWRSRYGELRGLVDTRNLRAQRWLSWAGFELGDIVPVGPFGRPFRTIHMLYRVNDTYRSAG